MDEIAAAVGEVQRLYPQIYHACHVRHSRRRSTSAELSAQDSMYLGHLDPLTPTTPRRLARHLGIADSTLSAFLKRMEGLGYVERRAGRDRREVELRQTQRGEDAMKAASILDGQRLAMVLSSIPDGERDLAVSGLRVLAAACCQAREEYEAGCEEHDGWKPRDGDGGP